MASARIPERFLRYLWQNQIFSSSRLLTSEGRRVVVRFPGIENTGSGPDFTGALIRIGRALYRGDVEIHAHVRSWRSHGHGSDPHYNRVILHAAFHGGPAGPPLRTASGRPLPLLLLSPYVDPQVFITHRSALRTPPAASLPCRRRKGMAARSPAAGILRELGRRRLLRRVRSLGWRLDQIVGDREEPPGDAAWEQLLYECIMEGMGYGGNRDPFLALARSVPLSFLRTHGIGNTERMQAILFGAAGLLPDPRAPRTPESRSCVRRLRSIWRALGPPSGILPAVETEWKFFRMRPVNFPTARLAAFCFLLPGLFAGRPIARILGTLLRPGTSPRARERALRSMFAIVPDRFWRRHRHFRGGGRGGGIALGRARVQELIVNGVIPVLLLLARLHADSSIRKATLELLRALRPSAENAVTRLVSGVLADRGTARGNPLEHQGMIHLFTRYCARGRCASCPLVHAVRTSPLCSRGRTSRSPRR